MTYAGRRHTLAVSRRTSAGVGDIATGEFITGRARSRRAAGTILCVKLIHNSRTNSPCIYEFCSPHILRQEMILQTHTHTQTRTQAQALTQESQLRDGALGSQNGSKDQDEEEEASSDLNPELKSPSSTPYHIPDFLFTSESLTAVTPTPIHALDHVIHRPIIRF